MWHTVYLCYQHCIYNVSFILQTNYLSWRTMLTQFSSCERFSIWIVQYKNGQKYLPEHFTTRQIELWGNKCCLLNLSKLQGQFVRSIKMVKWKYNKCVRFIVKTDQAFPPNFETLIRSFKVKNQTKNWNSKLQSRTSRNIADFPWNLVLKTLWFAL